MAQTIRIKRSSSTAAPSTLVAGELAYSDSSDKLWIGAPADNAVIAIGGKLYTDMLDHTAGTLTLSSAIIVDANSKIDQLKTANLTVSANAITSGSGDIDLIAAGNLDIDAATIDLVTQATEFSIKDNEAASIAFKENNNKYLTLVTTNSAEGVVLDKPLTIGLDGTAGFTLPTVDGTNLQALVTDGSGVVTWKNVTTVLEISGDTGTADVDGEVAAYTISGTDAIDTLASGTELAISIKPSSYTQLGASRFDSTDFTVTAGAVVVNPTTIGSTQVNPGETTTAFAGLTQLDFANFRLTGTTISTLNSNANIELAPQGNGVVNVPVNYKDRPNFNTNSLVSKGYVDAVKQALDIKASAKVATTANLAYTYDNGAGTLTAGSVGAVSIDGVALDTAHVADVPGTPGVPQRVLVKDQTDAFQNGIYNVTTVGDSSNALVLTRSIDADTDEDLTGGTFVFVEAGTLGGNNGFVFTHDGIPTLGTTALPVSQFSGAGQVITGTGLVKTGNEINIGSSPTILAQADQVEIRGITTTAIGDLLIGAASNAGYTRLVKPSGDVTASDYVLSMGTNGVAAWGNILDGGTF